MGVGRWMLLVPVLAAASLGAKTPTADELHSAITSTHTRVWGMDNLLLKPFTQATKKNPNGDVEAWVALMQQVETFVMAGKASGDLAQRMIALKQASSKAIGVREATFENFIKPALRPADQEAGLSRIEPKKIDFSKIDLETMQADNDRILGPAIDMAKSMEDKLSEEISILKNFKKKDEVARREKLEVLNRLTLTLELTMQKLLSDGLSLRRAAKPRS